MQPIPTTIDNQRWNPALAAATGAAKPAETMKTATAIRTVSAEDVTMRALQNSLDALMQLSKVVTLKPWMTEFMKSMPPVPVDPLSNAQPHLATTTHLVWDVELDHPNKRLIATATYKFHNKAPQTNDTLALDVSKLDIESVKVNGQPVTCKIVKSDTDNKPDGLLIPIGSSERGDVEIKYRTTDKSTGLFWVDKEYSDSKQHPIIYTLFEENEGASVVPGQHSPQVRMTYEVNAKTNDPSLMALSSVTNNPTARSPSGEYRGLKMGRAVPLYLLSLQVGNFAYRSYADDSRTGVYAEESMINRVHEAFVNLPKMMKAAEGLCGPYSWGKYTPVLLSWAFPYMAMEHPCASTCGAICLDNDYVIAHELAHAWAGNDITNGVWSQFFWNEGLTTFLENKITSRVRGNDYAAMLFLAEAEEMKEAMERYKEKSPDLLRLCQKTMEREFSRIPYVKGALFFFVLEKALGEQVFARFLQDYMQVFFQNSMSDARFLAFLKLWIQKECSGIDPDQFIANHKVHDWLYGTDIPSNAPQFESSFVTAFAQECDKLKRGEVVDAAKFASWDTTTRAQFLSLLKDVTPQQLAALDDQLKLTAADSMTIREPWATLCAKTGHITDQTKQMIVDYVLTRNSNYRTNVIAQHLAKTDAGKDVLRAILAQDGGRLFPLVKAKVERALETA